MYGLTLDATIDERLSSELYELCARADRAYAFIRSCFVREREQPREAEMEPGHIALGTGPLGERSRDSVESQSDTSDESRESVSELGGIGGSASSSDSHSVTGQETSV